MTTTTATTTISPPSSPHLIDSYRQHFQGVKSKELKLSVHARVCALSWSCDGKMLAAASTDRSVRVWSNLNHSDPALDISLAEPSDKANHRHTQVAFHPRVPNLFACCHGSLLLVYGVAGGEGGGGGEGKGEGGCSVVARHEFKGPVLNLAWNPSGTLLLLGTKNDLLLCLSFTNQSLLPLWSFECQFEANQFAFAPDDSLLIAGSPGTLHVLKDGAQLTHSLRLASATAYSIARSLSGGLAVGSADATITLFAADDNDAAALQHPACCISRLEWPVRHLSYSYDGLFLAAGSEDKFIDISRSSDGTAVHRLPVPSAVNALAWHPNSYLLAFSCDRVDKNGRSDFTITVFGFSQH